MTTSSNDSSGSPLPGQGQGATGVPSRRVLRHLWSKMAGAYGHRWVSAFGDSPERSVGDGEGDRSKQPELTDAGAMWSHALKGIALPTIAAGVRRCMLTGNGYPPTAPEFRALCLGIPPLAHVQLLLGRSDLAEDPHLRRFLLLVNRFCDPWRLNLRDPQAWERMVRDAYGAACAHVMAGYDLPVIPAGMLASPKKYQRPVPAPDEVVEEHMSRCSEMLGIRKGGSDEVH